MESTIKLNGMTSLEILEKLKEPFDPRVLSWRIGSTNRDKTSGMVLAYVNARDVMKRLDDVLGIGNWQNRYLETPSGRVFCELSVRLPNEQTGELEWVTKSDAAGATDIEGEKGAVSDALKRSAVLFGVARYLYYLDSPWVQVENKNGKAYLPKSFDGSKYLPSWALPKTQS